MQLHGAHEEIEQAGANLVIVGNGAPNFIAGFRERAAYTGVVYTDPELNAYRALSLRRSVRSSINLKSMSRAFKAYRKGTRQVGPRGDAWQQGGVFVVAPSGELLYEHRSRFAGDHPPLGDIIAAVRVA